MKVQQLLKELKVSGIRISEIAEKTGINIHTLYAISSGRKISKEKEQYILDLLFFYYSQQIARLNALRAIRN